MLIISYKELNKKLNIYDYKNTLYLINKQDIFINKLIGKFVEIIKKNIEEEIIEIISRYYKKFDHILLINNNNIVCVEKLFSFLNNINKEWIICGNIIKEKYDNNNFIPSFFDIDYLLINCLKLNISEINKQTIKDISFPIFSKIIYSNRKKCIDKNITKIINDNINLII